jgi:tRNA G10  N-methylase Trm11
MKRINQYIIYSLLLLFVCKSNGLYAQQPNNTVQVTAYIVNGDTIPFAYLEPVAVYTKLSKQQRKYWAEWTRLRNAVYVTYPYAKSASRVMNDINKKLAGITDKKQRKQIIKSREKELKKDFGDKLTNLSVYQGKVLMKLINRETGNNCYEIIEEYKGTLNAAFYQTVALVFGSNLRQSYDALNADKEMEKIVQDVERMYGYRS